MNGGLRKVAFKNAQAGGLSELGPSRQALQNASIFTSTLRAAVHTQHQRVWTPLIPWNQYSRAGRGL